MNPKQSLEHALGVGKASLQGNHRKAGKEQYYSPEATALDLVRLAQGAIPYWPGRTWIEPAAGTGAFVRAFQATGVSKILAYDIEPKSEGIVEADFLTLDLPADLLGAVSVTNPPFGRNSSLSVPFFNRLAPHCDYIGFVVPRSWRKWSVQARLDRSFHLLLDEDLAIDYVDEAGEPLVSKGGQLRTVFQLWEKREVLRPLVSVEDRGFIQKVTPAQADVALIVFGRACGTLVRDFDRSAKNTTHMYLKLLRPEALPGLKQANFRKFFDNVAFVEALSLDEINAALNEWADAQPSVPAR